MNSQNPGKVAYRQFQRFLTASPAFLYLLRITGRETFLVWMSENLERITGWKDIDSGNWQDWWIENIHVEDRAVVERSQQAQLRAKCTSMEYRFRRPDGAYTWIRDERQLLKDDKGRVEIAGAWVDISHQKRLESQLIQAQKMEAIGVFAGGIAHDFNNLLTIIRGHTELALEQLPGGNPSRPDLEQVKKAGEQGAFLTAQLLAFSRNQSRHPQILNLNDTVVDMRGMLARLIGDDIELSYTTQADLGPTYAEPGHLQQIIMNLVVNARDAMPNGGKLSIETSNVSFDESRTLQHLDPSSESYVMLAVCDTGVGMDADTCTRMFEPFFTTKESGKGTGLGLSTVYEIVKQAKGVVSVQSKPGHGTTIRVYLPRVRQSPSPPEAENTMISNMRGSETILVVEDEAAVRALVNRVLQMAGYRVLEASDGSEALRVFQDNAGKIDLVITDISMPRMSGNELIRHLSIKDPEIKALFISGYSDEAVLRNGAAGSRITFLRKPFTVENLLRAVRNAIHEGPDKAAPKTLN